jgi:ATP-dependent Lon protease
MGPGTNDFFTIQNANADKDGLIEAYLIPLREMIIFPHMITPVFVMRERSLAAMNTANSRRQTMIGVAQKDPEILEPSPADLFTVGTEIALSRPMRMPDNTSTALAQGRRRVEIVEFLSVDPYFKVRARVIEPTVKKNREVEAQMRAALNLFQKCVDLSDTLSDEAFIYAANADEPGWLADVITHTLDLQLPERQAVLELYDPVARLKKVISLLGKELDMLEIEEQIQSQVQTEMERGQREMFLREQLRVIQNELGEGDNLQADIIEIREKLEHLGMPEEVHQKALKELNRLAAMPSMAPEVTMVRTYLDWLVELPWSAESTDNLDMVHAAKVLEEQHFGLPKAKDRILEHIAVRKLAPDEMKTPILCFVGPPGTGKTSLGQSIAASLGREFIRVSLGGVRDEAEIRGHRRTYIGALPGRILQTMRRVKTINPVFMLDEIDKLGQDFRGDPAAALLEVLDPEQNKEFVDHYLDLPYDLSKIMFVTTANSLEPLPSALLDRLEVIEFPGYIEEEKISIANRFLIPRQIKQTGVADRGIAFSTDALQTLIREYTYEAGVRNLEREIANICRKIARKVASEQPVPQAVTPELITEFLGPPNYLQSKASETDQVGVATGLAWSEGGGEIMEIEVSLLNGKGGMTLTGSLGDVMKESAEAALTYTRSRAKDLGIKDTVFDKTDIHVHLPEGAIPKDGPSAGITLATALISALTGRKIHRTVGMTGELTLRGRVLAIGGIREKVLAAQRAGLKTVIYPKRNEKDLVEIPKESLSQLVMIGVTSMDEVIQHALEAAKPVEDKPVKPRKPRTKAAKPESTELVSDDSKPKTPRRRTPKPTPVQPGVS